MPDFIFSDFAMQFTGWLLDHVVLTTAAALAWLLAGWLALVRHLDAKERESFVRREIDAMKAQARAEWESDQRKRMGAVVRISDRKGA